MQRSCTASHNASGLKAVGVGGNFVWEQLSDIRSPWAPADIH